MREYKNGKKKFPQKNKKRMKNFKISRTSSMTFNITHFAQQFIVLQFYFIPVILSFIFFHGESHTKALEKIIRKGEGTFPSFCHSFYLFSCFFLSWLVPFLVFNFLFSLNFILWF